MVCMPIVRIVMSGCLLLAAGGCGRKLPTVEGIVTLDGTPLAGAAITFIPLEQPEAKGGLRQASGLTDEQGHFRLDTSDKNGALPGTYKVTLSKYVLPSGAQRPPANAPDRLEKMRELAKQGRQAVPQQFTDQKTTPLQFDISASGRKDILIELKSGT